MELALGRSVGADEVRSAFSFSGSDRNHVMVTEAADLGNSDDARVPSELNCFFMLTLASCGLMKSGRWTLPTTKG